MIIQNSVGASSPATTGGSSAPVAHAGTAPAVAVAVHATESSAAPSPARLQNAVDSINKSFQQNGTNMQFTIDPGTKENVVKVTDTNTGQVIGQYPSQVTLAISAAIDQEMNCGALVNQKA